MVNGWNQLIVAEGDPAVFRTQGRNKEGAIPRAPSHYGGAKSLQEGPRSPNNVTSSLLSSIHYICLRKTSVSNMGAPNLLLAPGAI